MKLPLTDATRAAILAGATEIEVDVEAAGQQASAGAPDAETETPAVAAAAAAELPASTETPAVETPAAPAANTGASSELVSFLKGELSTAQAALTAAQVEIAQLKAAAPDQGLQDKLVGIARGIVGNMQVAMGGTKAAVEAMDAKAVVAEHERIQPLFAAKFKVGGVAVTTPPTTKPQAQVISPDFQARLASTR